MSVYDRFALRVGAELLVAAVALFTFLAYLDARAADQWNYRANLWISLVTAGIGILGWIFPRAVGWLTAPFTALWFLWAVLYAGAAVPGWVIGGIPFAISVLFILSGRPRYTVVSVEVLPLTVVHDEGEAEIICGLLRANGIDCSYRKTDFVAGSCAVLVSEADVVTARELLSQR